MAITVHTESIKQFRLTIKVPGKIVANNSLFSFSEKITDISFELSAYFKMLSAAVKISILMVNP